jgi:hypothetical protein
MKLNQNSISARLYRWFYLTEDMPKNLCPYFWKLVLMYILLIPCSVLYLPITIARIEATETGERVALGFFSWLAVFGAIVMLFPITYFFYGWFPEKSHFGAWQNVGIALWICAFIIASSLGLLRILNKRKEKMRMKHRQYIWNEDGEYVSNPDYVPYEPKPNILIEFVKAKYNKYCPQIEWKNEINTEN